MWPEISAVKQDNKRELSLNGDKFTKQLSENEGKLDNELFQLKQLNFLQLSHSAEFCAIPDDIQKLENLQSLLLFGNQLTALPRKLASFINSELSFNFLIFTQFSLVNFPGSIENLNKLKILDVSNNKLTEFNYDFSKMENLSSINLSGNEITSFVVKAPPSLHILDLSQNKLSQFPELPSSITDLKMSKNQLKDIPDDMQLPNLKNLDLSENQITGIPKSVGGLKLKSKLRNDFDSKN